MMKKYAQLVQKINKFSTDSHWTYGLVKSAADSQELLNKAEQFDIKDENLFNQFETFMDAYRDLVETLKISPENLNEESFEDAAQLAGTLEKRYERLLNNPYLVDGVENDTYMEEFNPADFIGFISEVAQDVKNKISTIAGDEIDISEMLAAQYANEFNQQVDQRDQNLRWTGDKVEQALKARQNHADKMKFLLKHAPNSPEALAYRQRSRDAYARLKADKERYEAYKNRANERAAKKYDQEVRKGYSAKRIYTRLQIGQIAQRISEIPNEITMAKVNKNQELADQLMQELKDLREQAKTLRSDYENIKHTHLDKSKEIATKIKRKKQFGDIDARLQAAMEKGDNAEVLRLQNEKSELLEHHKDDAKNLKLDGLATKLLQQINSGKIIAKQKITDKMPSNDKIGEIMPEFAAEWKALKDAKQSGDTFAIGQADKALNKAKNNFAEKDANVQNYDKNAEPYRNLVSALKTIKKNNWLDPSIVSMVRPQLENVLQDAAALSVEKPNFVAHAKTIKLIEQFLKEEIQKALAESSNNQQSVEETSVGDEVAAE